MNSMLHPWGQQWGEGGVKTYLTGPGLAWALAVMVRFSPSTASSIPFGTFTHTGASVEEE